MIMPHGYSDATIEEIDEVTAKLCKLYPHISYDDHRLIADITYDNYFSKEGMWRWYERTASKLTPKVLESIKKDAFNFFYCESHLAGETYIALADRDDI